MAPTVADVLALPVVLAGRPELLNPGAPLGRAVRWVHVVEAADAAGLIRGGELVLCAGLAFADGSAATHRYLDRLAEAGAAALVAELIDAAAVDRLARAATRVDFPVVALRRVVRFVEITEVVHRALVSERFDRVEFAERVHRRFTTLNLDRAGPGDIIALAAELVGGPVVLEDLAHRVLAFAVADGHAGEVLADWPARSRLAALEKSPDWLRVAVDAAGPWGRLVAPVPAATATAAAAATALTVLERAGQALELHHLIERDRHEVSRQSRSTLVDDLRAGRITAETDAMARASALGFRPGRKQLPVVVAVSGDPGRGTADVLTRAATARGLSLVASSSRPDRLVALLAVGQEGEERTLYRLCAGLAEELPASRWVIGVGPAGADLVTAAAGLPEAEHVAEAAVGGGVAGRHHRARDVRLPGLALLLGAEPRVHAFAEAQLRPLLDREARGERPLLPLLRRFLQLGGNKAELARELSLSRATLYKRLATVERLLEADLDDGETRAALHLAVLTHDLGPARRT
ncbi:hypothetical protein BLA60_27430 [Actinophytocola xinjiangensis]|uniref:Purine catabolism regulator n=1 Tax=Actinophytocola xinjiangensis TaxID=485602 RepID=A0A7Z1AX52_9PSEU|nr:PucR family transcriptional regulator ligand-binding domain-containing protein [Actinophytocola xinjiangensis]OLF07311.1 hypothetical protein BLA60_27430 [Actinophytocola xinjiangensis]